MPEKQIVPDFELPLVELEEKISELKKSSSSKVVDKVELANEIKLLQQKHSKLKKEIFSSLNSYQRIQLARHPKRPYTLDYVNLLFADFIEIYGDRYFADDKSVVCGLAMFEKEPVVVIGQQKARTVAENIERNFGMMHPEGYRKALRVMQLANKFSRPIIIFIDTPGAYPGIGAEERGQAEAIAKNLREMAGLKVPIISIVISEGSSGGALGIGISDKILMLENSYYSVISPEGCAAILFRDANRAAEAATALKLTANDLFEMKIADEIIPEPFGGSHTDINETVENIRNSIKKYLNELKKIPSSTLIETRYKKYRNIGTCKEQ